MGLRKSNEVSSLIDHGGKCLLSGMSIFFNRGWSSHDDRIQCFCSFNNVREILDVMIEEMDIVKYLLVRLRIVGGWEDRKSIFSKRVQNQISLHIYEFTYVEIVGGLLTINVVYSKRYDCKALSAPRKVWILL